MSKDAPARDLSLRYEVIMAARERFESTMKFSSWGSNLGRDVCTAIFAGVCAVIDAQLAADQAKSSRTRRTAKR